MKGWDGNMTLGLLPELAARRWGDRDALMYRGRWETFTELSENVDRIAAGLIEQDVRVGDKVAVWLNNCPEWIYLMFAIAKIGAVQVPINTRFRTDDTEYNLGQADCSVLITHDVSGPIDYLEMVRRLVPDEQRETDGTVESKKFPALRRIIIKPADGSSSYPGTLDWAALCQSGDSRDRLELTARAARVSPDDTLFIMFTSGTTGFPKGVMRHHGFLRNQSDRIAHLESTESDLMYNYLPLFHVFGYVDGPLQSVMTGNRQILAETFDPDKCLDSVEREGVTQLCGFESHLKALIDAQEKRARNLSSLRTGIFAAGMLSATPIMQKALKVLAPLRPVTAYGMTELGANVSLSRISDDDERICETSGRPCGGFDIRIIDPESGDDQPAGVPGEIIVKTYNVMQGYYRKPDETTAALDSDGWFHSGDMGYLREDGYLRFLGRYKDMLKIGGENVDPMEVEASLQRHPNVGSVAVVGYPDNRLTEVAVAFVVPETGQSVSTLEIQSFCKGRIASFKVPKHVITVDDLPMTSTGKVQKVKLREQAISLLAREGGY